MNSSELTQLIAQNEGQKIEFKLESEKQADLAEVLMAFANAEGGHLFVGVTDDSEIIGVENIKTIVDRLHNAARRLDPSLHTLVSVEQVQIANKTIIVAEVPENLTATYSLAGSFKIREGSFNRQMTSTDVIGHAVRRGTLAYEETFVNQATLDDVSEEKVKEFLIRRLRSSIPDRPFEQLLHDMRVIARSSDQNWHPTVAGLLFFGNWPQFHLNHATILAARLIGARGVQIVDRATIEGTVPEMLDRAIQFVQRNTRHGLKISQTNTARAKEIDEYPIEAVREAITNACCHRDYLERTPIQLKIYDDRLVISNPGGLLPGLDIGHLEGKHKARNPLLAEWLHTLGYIERFGIGILRIKDAMHEAGLPSPIFRNSPDWFEVTLPGPGVPMLGKQAQSAAMPTVSSSSSGENKQELSSSRPWYHQTWSFKNHISPVSYP